MEYPTADPTFFGYYAPELLYPMLSQSPPSQVPEFHGINQVYEQPAFTPGHTHSFNPSPTPWTIKPHNVQSLSDTQDIPPAESMGPPTNKRKRKAPTLRANAWDPYKDRIIELHITQNLPLQKVKDIIQKEFGFTAELRQYRTRISQWGLDKKVKTNEMEAIARKRQRRRLVETNKRELIFVVRENIVEDKKINRWMTKNGIDKSNLYAPSPATSTPSAVDCWTVSERGSPVPSPTPSARTPTFGMRGFLSTGQSPCRSSPALSVSSIIRSTSSTFTGQSPAPGYRSISVSEALTVQPSFLSQHLWEHAPQIQTGQPPIGSVQHRYRQEDEMRLRQELSILETLHGRDHSETLHTLCELGVVLMDQGRYKSAEELFRRLVVARQKWNGDNNINTLEAFECLGQVLEYQGNYVMAEKMHRRTYESRKDALGYEHPGTLASMANLASTYWNQGRWKEAEELEVQVMETSLRLLGQEHPDTLASIGDLASTKRVLGQEHPDTLTSMANLASTYRNQGRWKEAEELEVPALETRKRVLGREHPHTLTSIVNLAFTWKSQHRDNEALALMGECFQLQKKRLGPDHPNTMYSLTALNKWQREIWR
ncbi:TPR-like protein [Lepidopterella palustris CBS 459.81]|uniref:TPR-like protein n=1 Tax=Lepidopterella palustris CBS 459.81 TaxID=1314670 RepID=A0A8E2EM76_9PEZI|nr:TPR-like protein [Lepidopterella palustris CBS 459.81]